jgi:MFS family permease
MFNPLSLIKIIPYKRDDRYPVVAGAFLVMMLAWGIYYSFGIFMIPLLEEFGWTRANTAGAFAMAVFIEGLGGIYAGRLADRWGIRRVMVGCAILIAVACMGMFLINNLWQFYLCYGLCLGLGLSCTYTPLASNITRIFTRQRGLMMGIVVAGLGMGSLVITPFADYLLRHFNWRISFVVLGGVALAIISGSTRWFRPDAHLSPGSDAPSKIWEETHANGADLSQGALLPTGGAQQLVLMCGILLCWGYAAYGMMAHFAAYAIALDIKPSQAALALAFMGGMISIAKIIIGLSTDRFGNKATLLAALVMMFVSILWLKQARLLWEFYIFAAFFAFGFACASVVMPGLVADTFGLQSHGFLLGITNVFACAGCAIGPVLTGHIYDVTGNYASALWFFAGSGLASVVIASCLRSSRRTIEANTRREQVVYKHRR